MEAVDGRLRPDYSTSPSTHLRRNSSAARS
jgi:hypothetical protein